MKKYILRLRVLLPAALICILVMIMASAGNITSSDPLISLSYLNGTFKTQLTETVNGEIRAQITELETRLNKRIDGIKAAVTVPATAVPTHSAATIPANASYTVPGGSEFLFLSGDVVVSAAGITDVTEGIAVPAQGQLVQNHLYSAVSPVVIKTSAPAKIIIRK